MRHTFLEKNPFYILEVSPGEKRASIIAKAEEKAFFSKGNECEEAQSSLINPARRASAELEWFFGLTVNQQVDIIDNIRNHKEISTDGLLGISLLNALVHNFAVCEFEDFFEIGYAILEIDELYDALSTLELCETINKYRTQSGIAPVKESDVIDGLGKRRTAIRQIITATLETLTNADYIELVSMIAEKCIADENYEDGVIIGDVIDQYEVRMKSAIDDKMEAALALIGKVNANTNKPVIDLTVKNLISTLKEFDKYAQPLQIKSSKAGADHEQSLHLARESREFAIELHNEYDCTDASFKLIRALREIFPELTEFAEIIANDEKQITKIRKDREQFKKDLEANRQANKHYTVNIRGDRFAIPPFCTCCMKPTTNKENVSYSSTTQRGRTQTTRSISVDMPICDECLKHRSQYNWLLVLICSISIVIGSIFMAILMAAGVDGFLSFLLGGGAAVGAYFGVSAIWKTKPLAREHARRGKSASIFSLFMDSYMASRMSSCSGVIFTFYNWEYAHLFREANKDIAIRMYVSDGHIQKRDEIYDVDMENGRFTEKDQVEITNSSYVTISHNSKYLYSITDFGVEAYKIEKDGSLTVINQGSINGMRGCYLSTDYEDKFLFVAGYHDGKITVLRLREDGGVGEITNEIFHKGLGICNSGLILILLG